MFALLLIGIGGNDSWAQEINDGSRLNHAKILYQKGLYTSAREEFSGIQNPQYLEEARYYKAMSAVRASHDDGEFLVRKFIDDYPSNYFAEHAFFELGNFYFERGEFSKASDFYEKSSKRTDELNFKLGYSYFQIKKLDEAKKSFAELTGVKNQWGYDAAYFLGFIENANGDDVKAKKFLKIAFESEKYRKDAMDMFVAVLYQVSDYRGLVEFVTQNIEGRMNGVTLNYLANAYYALQEYQEASEQFSQLLAKHSKFRNSRNYYKAGYSSFKIQNFKESEDKLKRAAVQNDTVGAYASYYLGVIYSGQKNLPFAVTSFGNTAKYNSKIQEEAYYRQARALLKIPDFQKAIEVLNQSKEKYPSGKYESETDEMLSLAYLHTNNYGLAMEYIEALPELTETVKNVYQRVSFIHGKELFNSKKFKEASKAFQKSLVYNTDQDLTQQTFYWMGESLMILENEKDAVFYYRSVKSLNPPLYLKAEYGLGYAYFNVQNYAEASDAFARFERDFDGSISEKYKPDALLRLADCYFALKAYDKSITYYNKALKSGNKKLGQIYFQIGLLNRYLEKDVEAKKYFLKLIKEVPGSTKKDHAQFQIAEIDFKNGKTEQAVEAYRVFICFDESGCGIRQPPKFKIEYDQLQRNTH